MIKRFLALALAVMVGLMGVPGAFAQAGSETLTAAVNGRDIETPARIFEGELYLPLRAVAEELGFNVGWLEQERKITLTQTGKDISLNLEDLNAAVDGHEGFVRGGHRMVEGRTYLPQGFFNDILGLKVTWDRAAKSAALQSVRENAITIGTKKEVAETDKWKLNIQYPEIQGLEDGEVQDKINSVFARLAADAKNSGSEAAKIMAAEELLPDYFKAETYFNYQVKYNRSGLLSIVFSDYQYSGGAHGLTVQKAYTFDLKTGEQYLLKDIFTEGSGYVSLITGDVKRQMAEREMTETLVPFEAIREDQDFYLSNNGVVVYFQAYEYYPYAYGIPEFAVDFSSMNEILLPNVK